jgi:predicted nucleic acid-binding protein
LVLDANVFVGLLVPGEYRPQARSLWERAATNQEPCVVPAFCPTEVISSLRQLGRAGVLTPIDEEEAVEEFLMVTHPSLVVIESAALTYTAWEIARELDERHTYDSVYLAIARAFDTEFWTADRQLLRRLDGRIPQARFLGDYPLV